MDNKGIKDTIEDGVCSDENKDKKGKEKEETLGRQWL